MIRGLQLIGIGAVVPRVIGRRVDRPGKGENRLINGIKHQITVGGGKGRNALGHRPDVAEEGKTAFGAYCVVCDGLDGQNTGVPSAVQMPAPVRSLASKRVQDYTDSEAQVDDRDRHLSIWHAGFARYTQRRRMWSIVTCLGPAAGSLGEQAVYSGKSSSPPPQSPPSEAQTNTKSNGREGAR